MCVHFLDRFQQAAQVYYDPSAATMHDGDYQFICVLFYLVSIEQCLDNSYRWCLTQPPLGVLSKRRPLGLNSMKRYDALPN